MRKACLWGLALALLAFTTSVWSGEAMRNAMREKMRERFEQVREMRKAAQDFFAAKEAGNRDAAMTAAAHAQEIWNGLPEKWRSAIEERHPGTGERLAGLKEEYGVEDAPAATAAARSANTSASVTGPAGNTTTSNATWTKEGNTVTKDATVTGPNGKTATQDATWTKDGNSVTRDGSTTTSTGKSVTSEDTWTKNGNTVTHEGSSTTNSGRTATRNGTWTRDDSTVTHDGSRTGFGGCTTTREGVTTREVNTLSHQGAASHFKPNYKDETDVFGGRPKPSGHRQRR